MERREKQRAFEAKRTAKLAETVTVNAERELTIYTWGANQRKEIKETVDHHFDVRNISLDDPPRTETGRDATVQTRILSITKFYNYIQNIVKKIEDKHYNSIAICCHRGKHRSVAIAEILKNKYYPLATVVHYEI